MMRNLLRIKDYFHHMIEAIDRIETYTDGFDLSAFRENTLVQDAVIRNIEIIGEAANKILTIDAQLSAENPKLRLDLAYRMRNALAHGYHSVNLGVVWTTITADLPNLKIELRSVLSRLPP